MRRDVTVNMSHAEPHSAERLEPLGGPSVATQGGPIQMVGEGTTAPIENGNITIGSEVHCLLPAFSNNQNFNPPPLALNSIL